MLMKDFSTWFKRKLKSKEKIIEIDKETKETFEKDALKKIASYAKFMHNWRNN